MINKGIIFDLDGTLWNSSEKVVPAWNRVFERYKDIDCNITVSQMQSFMGKRIPEIAKILLPSVPEQYRLQILNECCKEEQIYLLDNGGVLYPKLEDTLSELRRDFDLFIVSNCQDGYIEAFLDYHKLRYYFLDTECSGRTGKSKGENIKTIINRNHLDKAIYIGDTQGDLDAAKEAEIHFVHAKYGFGSVNEDTYVINSFFELSKIISEII